MITIAWISPLTFTLGCLLVASYSSEAAPTNVAASLSVKSAADESEHKADASTPSVKVLQTEATEQLANSSPSQGNRVLRSTAHSELDTQETGFHLPQAYPSAVESDYGYDSGKNAYGKQASDWSLYDQGEFERLVAYI